MKFDLETDTVPDVPLADVCIVGSGVAGLILGDALRRKGLRVDILEAGGSRIERGEPPFSVHCSGHCHTGATNGRCRVFGGTSALWGGQLLPFGEEVFGLRPGRADTEWPIGSDAIYRHADEVLKTIGVNDLSFGSDFPQHINRSKYILQSEEFRVRYSKWIPFSRRNFAKTLGKSLEADAGTRIILHANVVSIEMNPAGDRVESVHCRTSNGRRARFRARQFVLATGTIEVVRLLLASWQGTQRGIGNTHGQVGRYFHDHLGVVVGEIQPPSIRRWEYSLAPWLVGGVLHTARIEAPPHLVATRQWLDVMACCTFDTTGSGFERFRQLLKDRQLGRCSLRQLAALAFHVPSHLDLLRLAVAAQFRKRRLLPKGGRVEIQIFVEQLPVSSIRLASQSDAFGVPRAIVNWRISREEITTAYEFCELLRRQWKPAWGGVTWHQFSGPEAYLQHTQDTFHMMGGTRMGRDEHTSVVDPSLKVHGVNNLYIASCAVYPSGGSSNPTFTLMCLCLRLSEVLVRAIHSERAIRTMGVFSRE